MLFFLHDSVIVEPTNTSVTVMSELVITYQACQRQGSVAMQ